MIASDLKKITEVCSRTGIVFPTAEPYGGFAGFYDWGVFGCELKKNIKDRWWRFFVHGMDDVVGIDGCIITHPKVWKASGHVDHFFDPIAECGSCGEKFRADHLLEDVLGIKTEGLSVEDIERIIRERGVKCPKCGGNIEKVTTFNLMFSTQVGPYEGTVSYLRPETAQLIFVNFPRVYQIARKKMPLGIAQVGKAFRNEISPRGFIFRLREFEQMEIEFFFDPENDKCPYFDEVKDFEMKVLTAEMQEEERKEEKKKVSEVVDKEIPGYEWLVYWIVKSAEWFVEIGVDKERMRIRQQLPDERAHYSMDTWDIEYFFGSMGWKEIEGIAHRSDYDLSRHQEFSGQKFEAVRSDGSKFIPFVIEPSWGVERAVMAVLFSTYAEENGRSVFRFKPEIAPVKVAVFPLVSRDGLPEIAKNIYGELKKDFLAVYDESGSIGKRYRRQDEIGTPFCITVDYQTKEDGTVTVRERDSMNQQRVEIGEVRDWLSRKLFGK